MTETLLEQWDENNDRLHWIQAHSEELEAATGVSIPDRLHELDEWLETHKGVVTRKLREQTESDDQDGDDESETAEES